MNKIWVKDHRWSDTDRRKLKPHPDSAPYSGSAPPETQRHTPARRHPKLSATQNSAHTKLSANRNSAPPETQRHPKLSATLRPGATRNSAPPDIQRHLKLREHHFTVMQYSHLPPHSIQRHKLRWNHNGPISVWAYSKKNLTHCHFVHHKSRIN